MKYSYRFFNILFFVGVVICLGKLSWHQLFAVDASDSEQSLVIPVVTFTPDLSMMPATQIKETLLKTLRSEAIQISTELFYVEHCSLSKNLIACLLMSQKEHSQARKFLCSQQNLSLDVLKSMRDHLITGKLLAQLELLEGHCIGHIAQTLAELIDTCDVQPLNQHEYKRVGYKNYYANKGEDFSLADQATWENKQRSVYEVLQEKKPKTVLDLGANTGWYARLAAQQGALVKAIDIDEASTDYLYQVTQHNNESVVPMVCTFDNLLDTKKAQEFSADIVFCLGLVHHLVFINGIPLEDILDCLALLTKKTLILEFISLEDDSRHVLTSGSFWKDQEQFKKAQANYAKFHSSYRKDDLEILLKKRFSSVTYLASNPATRSLLICSK